MKVTVEISDEDLKNAVLGTIVKNGRVIDEAGIGIREATATAVKELVYSRKDELIERCVDRASKELVRKGMPKLIERMAAENDG